MNRTIRNTAWCCVCLFVAFHCGAPISRSQDGGKSETEKVTKWFTSRAIPLKSVDDKESFSDLKPFKQVLRGVRIVGLGEETHGTHEFFQLKRRLIQFLVKEAGFTVFAMELSYAASVDINEYVLNGKGDRNKLLARQGLWAWDTEEVAEVIEMAAAGLVFIETSTRARPNPTVDHSGESKGLTDPPHRSILLICKTNLKECSYG